MAIDQKISNIVKDQFPDFYKEDAPTFLEFMKAYYEYMEQSGKTIHEMHKLTSYKDIDDTTDEYLEYFRRTILASIPQDVLVNKRLLAKHIKDFYQSKGTISSYKFLFRILYDEDVEVSFPADQMLRVSDGDYRLDRYVVCAADERLYTFIGKTVVAIGHAGAEGFVENVVRRNVNGRDLMQVNMSRIKGNFSKFGERIKLKNSVSGTGFEPVIEAGISSLSIITAGASYLPGDIVYLNSSFTGGLGKAVITNTVNLQGGILFTLNDGGSGFTASTEPNGTEIKIEGGDGSSGASFVIGPSDITDTFAISRNINSISSNTTYGALAPSIPVSPVVDPTAARPANVSRQMSTFANVIIGASDYGFKESSEELSNGIPFRTNTDAAIKVANTRTLSVGDSLFGASSSANAKITTIIDSTAGASWFRVDTYKNFTAGAPGESINIGTFGGASIGTCTTFQANSVSQHQVQIGLVPGQSISVGDELVGMTERSATAAEGYEGNGLDKPMQVGMRNTYAIVKKQISAATNGYLHAGTSNTTLSGTVSSTANTITGVGTTFSSDFTIGDEIKAGGQSGQRIVAITNNTSLTTSEAFSPVLSGDAYGKGGTYRTLLTLKVSANTSSNLISHFDSGPMNNFLETEGVRKVASGTVVGNVVSTTSNAAFENVYTKLQDALVFEATTFGTVDRLSLRVTGAGFSIPPTVTLIENDIAALEIRDVVLYVQNSAPYTGTDYFNTGNSSIISLDENDRLYQSTTSAAGDVKSISPTNPQQFDQLSTTVHANGTFVQSVRVWQDELQGVSNIKYSNNSLVATKHYSDASQTTLVDTGSMKIVKIVDNGILGKNATITASVGANGTATQLRTIDSGFGYVDGEVVTLTQSNRTGSASATVRVNLGGAANAEGYYATARSHISTKRGFIQDSYKYQEFSYEVATSVAFPKYRDLVNNLIHPAGQKLFGKFRTRQVANLEISVTKDFTRRTKSVGTVAISSNTFNLVGTSTLFTTNYANGDNITIQTGGNTFMKARLNKVNSATTANLISWWTEPTIAGANAYYYTGTLN
jgi:hypothetical protein